VNVSGVTIAGHVLHTRHILSPLLLVDHEAAFFPLSSDFLHPHIRITFPLFRPKCWQHAKRQTHPQVNLFAFLPFLAIPNQEMLTGNLQTLILCSYRRIRFHCKAADPHVDLLCCLNAVVSGACP
jgi:hypothetical protein